MLRNITIIKPVKSWLAVLSRKFHWLLLGFAAVLFILLMLQLVRGQSSAKINQAELMQLKYRLDQVEKKNAEQVAQLKQIKPVVNEQIAKLDQQINVLADKQRSANSHLEDTIQTVSSSTQQLTSQINRLQAQVIHIKRQIKPQAEPNYLPVSMLPFRVMGIDIWNGVTKVTVNVRNEVNLMAVNDSLAGWTLIHVAIEPATAVFKSKNNQFIKVTL